VKSEIFTKWPILDQKTRVTLRNFIVFFLPFFYFDRSSTSCRLKIHQICQGFLTFYSGWTFGRKFGVLTENCRRGRKTANSIDDSIGLRSKTNSFKNFRRLTVKFSVLQRNICGFCSLKTNFRWIAETSSKPTKFTVLRGCKPNFVLRKKHFSLIFWNALVQDFSSEFCRLLGDLASGLDFEPKNPRFNRLFT
jgi:hypothetical protein